MNGGAIVARILQEAGTSFLFTLVGGHISPILVESRKAGIRVVDVRHEATAVFAADAVARLTGSVGVAAVTAGPGVTNTITALKNAQMAHSPVLLLGGAAATLLKGRGALQDIDHMSLVAPIVKWADSVTKLRDLPEKLRTAMEKARAGVPGPVFLEIPIDLLYDESVVREWTQQSLPKSHSVASKAMRWYVERHLENQFRGGAEGDLSGPNEPEMLPLDDKRLARVAGILESAKRPVLVASNQVLNQPGLAEETAAAIRLLGIPTWLTGGARGLLGRHDPIQFRHKRKEALKEADVVILAGVPHDFRLGYGRQVSSKARVISVNLSFDELTRNRWPDAGFVADPGVFLRHLAKLKPKGATHWSDWLEQVEKRDSQREEAIVKEASEPCRMLNPLRLAMDFEEELAKDSILVADGGDFVASMSYVVRPRNPLSWLDPGPFGTLGVGAGFALGAKLVHPEADVWALFGDGSFGYSLMEFDTFVRHKIPVIALIGNDASWAQIARDQVEILHDDVATVLNRSDYHKSVEGLGAVGLEIKTQQDTTKVLKEAVKQARAGHPVAINVHLCASDFRKGSISV